MSAESRDVTDEYREAEAAADKFNPGEQPDIAALMRSAFVHGYAQALIDYPAIDAPAATEQEPKFPHGLANGQCGTFDDGETGRCCQLRHGHDGPHKFARDAERQCPHVWEGPGNGASKCLRCGEKRGDWSRVY